MLWPPFLATSWSFQKVAGRSIIRRGLAVLGAFAADGGIVAGALGGLVRYCLEKRKIASTTS